MPEQQTTERLEPFLNPSCVNKGSENPQEAISPVGWLPAAILHDLRNPLSTICAGAELLVDLDAPSTQVKRLAGNMCRAAGRMRQLLAELASLARDNVPTAETCDIRQVIGAAAEAALTVMGHQSIQILLDVPTGIDLPLVRSHIERVFFNLIANAIEAMPSSGEIRIRARKAGGCAIVELEDTGPGIPGFISDRLFEPFVTSGKQDGLGLGLALARQSVRNHGGDMWTEPAAGARFVIRLPLDETGCGLRRAASSEKIGQAADAPTGPRLKLELCSKGIRRSEKTMRQRHAARSTELALCSSIAGSRRRILGCSDT
jgi:nitrogen-specific signal transduction histidine kinase